MTRSRAKSDLLRIAVAVLVMIFISPVPGPTVFKTGVYKSGESGIPILSGAEIYAVLANNNGAGNVSNTYDVLSYNWAGHEFYTSSGYYYYQVGSYVNVEAVQIPPNPSSCTFLSMSVWIALEVNEGGSKGLIQFGYGISPNSNTYVALHTDGTDVVTVPPDTAYLWWEYVNIGGYDYQPYTIFEVGVANPSGGVATVPLGSVLSLSMGTNTNSQGYWNQVIFDWWDATDNQFYTVTANLPLTVRTTYSAFIVEAPTGSEIAQIPEFSTVQFYNSYLSAVGNGAYSSFTTNHPYAAGNWVTDFMVQTSWFGEPDPFVQGNIGEYYGTQTPSYTYAYESGYSWNGWINSNYNLC